MTILHHTYCAVLNAAATMQAASLLSSSGDNKTELVSVAETRTNERHIWCSLDRFFVCDSGATGVDSEHRPWIRHEVCKNPKDENHDGGDNLTFVTWNVLFDLRKNEKNELIQGDDSLLGDGDETILRWGKLIHILSEEAPSVIALQEVTPRFLELILSQEWVQLRYSSSESASNPKTLEPYGNLTLWKTEAFAPLGLHLCRDVQRNRGNIVTLRHRSRASMVLNIANVHLPADQHNYNDGTIKDRTLARRKELGSFLAKLQILEQQQHELGVSIPMILGDFNSGEDEPDLLEATAFVDSWLDCYHSCNDEDSNNRERGFTFDWELNRRADKTRRHGHSERPPRRIDRIFVGRSPEAEFSMNIDAARVIGRSEGEAFPPSDHYGVSADFTVSGFGSHIKRQPPILYDPVHAKFNSWAAVANPTTESLLALVLQDDSPNINGTALLDPSSSLPIPHVTLLNGFVDLTSDESIHLAFRAVKDAVRQALDSNPSKTWSLPINRSSLTLFEHRASATMVCVPDVSGEQGGVWLSRLYNTLRATFPLCHEQESRFAGGWTPHLSLQSCVDVATARNAIDQILSEDAWICADDPVQRLQVYGVGLFRRDVSDGKFYPVTTVPLSQYRHNEVRPTDASAFLQDAGCAWSGSVMGASVVVLQELQRACDYANNKLYCNQLETSVHVYGSHALGVPLPGVSDLDTVVILKPRLADDQSIVRSVSDSQFLNCVSTRLSALHKGARSRMRLSSSPAGTALFLLTVKLSPQYPSLDVLLCRVDSAGEPTDVVGQTAIDSIRDLEFIHSAVHGIDFCPGTSDFKGWEVYQGALRVIKLWAFRRQIYGTSMGYLGGGGWAILLLWVLQRGSENNFQIQATSSLGQAAEELASFFFKNIIELYRNSKYIVTVSTSMDEELVERAAEIAAKRGSLSVLAPLSKGDFGRSTTASTTQTMWEEIRHAQRARSVDDLISAPYDIAGSSPAVLSLQLRIPSDSKPSEIKAWGATRALNLTVAMGLEISLRLSSVIVKKRGSFWYFWGLGTGKSANAGEIISKHQASLEEECKMSHLSVTGKLQTLSCVDYDELFRH